LGFVNQHHNVGAGIGVFGLAIEFVMVVTITPGNRF
jgi:hypothetical protein